MTKIKKLTIIVLVAICFISLRGFPVFSTNLVCVRSSFLTGNEYVKLDKFNKLSYVTGVIDGFSAAPLFGAPANKVKWYDNCISEMTNGQIVAIIDKYLKEHPEEWHWHMHVLIHNALREINNRH
jgi:hypothetical protein